MIVGAGHHSVGKQKIKPKVCGYYKKQKVITSSLLEPSSSPLSLTPLNAITMTMAMAMTMAVMMIMMGMIRCSVTIDPFHAYTA